MARAKSAAAAFGLPARSNADAASAELIASAANCDELAILRLLPAANARATDAEGRTALMAAAERGHPECAKALLAASDPAQTDNKGFTALMLAARRGNAACARLLLPVSPLDAQAKDGSTVMMSCVFAQGSDVLAELVARLGPEAAKKEARKMDKKGHTALMFAAMSGREDAVRLLAPFSDAKQRNKRGGTALTGAALACGLGCVRLLAGLSDVGARDQDGNDAIDYAFCRSDSPEVADWLASQAAPARQEEIAKSHFGQSLPRFCALREAQALEAAVDAASRGVAEQAAGRGARPGHSGEASGGKAESAESDKRARKKARKL